MNDTATHITVLLITFWILLTVLSGMFGYELSKTDITQSHDSTLEYGNPGWENNFVLFRIMTFQYTDNVPVYLSIFLDLLFILSALVLAIYIRG